uniref:Uncharacterized protein n=1 Tax=Populus trichocarpa TaxID=3694 RepID=A0A2K1XJL9_POPTR
MVRIQKWNWKSSWNNILIKSGYTELNSLNLHQNYLTTICSFFLFSSVYFLQQKSFSGIINGVGQPVSFPILCNDIFKTISLDEHHLLTEESYAITTQEGCIFIHCSTEKISLQNPWYIIP